MHCYVFGTLTIILPSRHVFRLKKKGKRLRRLFIQKNKEQTFQKMNTLIPVRLQTTLGYFQMQASVVVTDLHTRIHVGDMVYLLRSDSDAGPILKMNASSLALVDIRTLQEHPGAARNGPSALCELTFSDVNEQQYKAYFGRVSRIQYDNRDTYRALHWPLPGSVSFLLKQKALKPRSVQQTAAAKLRRAAKEQVKTAEACLVAEERAIMKEKNAAEKSLQRLAGLYEAAKRRAEKAEAAAADFFARI